MSRRPEWLDTAIFYEVYPQSFLDTDGDGIGNIKGITEKLTYIKDLGCNAVWINPCFVSPFGDAGYDVSDYCLVAPRYGTNEDLKELFDRAHALGMHVLLDLVPGHTSWEHPWFKESMKAEKNEYTDRYVWTDSAWEEPEGYGALRGISDRDGSCIVNFFTHQPALNYGFYEKKRPWQQSTDSKGAVATREALKDVMRFWLSMGCDGFRVDMAGSLVKNDPEAKGTIALWQNVRAFLDAEYPEAVMISEWGEPDKSLQGGFHMDFLLHFGPSHYNDLFRNENPFFEGNGDASEFVKKYEENVAKSQGKGLICIPSGNHDMDRLARHIKKDSLKLAFAFLLSMPGAPFIYYGDEIGMRYVEGLVSVEGGYSRTGSRSPMQWEGSENAGFSSAIPEKLYIPLDPDQDRPNVEEQRKDPGSLYSEVKKLISLRQEHKALQNPGKIEFVCDGAKEKPLAYIRSCDKEKILIIINPGNRKTRISLDGCPGKVIYQTGAGAKYENREWVIEPKTAVYIRLYRLLDLKEEPELMQQAAEWFHDKWSVSTEAYLSCMKAYLDGATQLGWYLCLDEDKIIAGMGVIENDFHDRKDLTPNVCAVYTEADCRKQGIAGELLHMVVEDMRKKEMMPLYLLTDHTSFYERYGWEFLCMVQGDGEDKLSRMYIHR